MKTVVVLGNARSGTSVTAGVLLKLGVKMCAVQVPDKHFAPKGYFECLPVHGINCEIYQILTGKTYREPHWWPPSLEDIQFMSHNLDRYPEVVAKIRQFLRQQNGIWGFKNPKTSLTIHIWHRFLENPHYIITVRHPLDCAESMRKIIPNKIDFDYALWLYQFYQDSIMRFVRAYDPPHMYVRFEEIVTNPIPVAKQLAEFVGLTFDAEKEKRVQEVVIVREQA